MTDVQLPKPLSTSLISDLEVLHHPAAPGTYTPPAKFPLNRVFKRLAVVILVWWPKGLLVSRLCSASYLEEVLRPELPAGSLDLFLVGNLVIASRTKHLKVSKEELAIYAMELKERCTWAKFTLCQEAGCILGIWNQTPF